VRPRLGAAGVDVQRAQVVAQQGRQRAGDELLVLGDDVLLDRGLGERAADEDAVEVRVLLDGREEGVEALADAGNRRLFVVHGRDEPVEEDLRAALPQRDEQVGLVCEVAVQHGFGDAGLGGDVVHPDIGAVLGERPHGRVDELGAPRRPVRPPPVASRVPTAVGVSRTGHLANATPVGATPWRGGPCCRVRVAQGFCSG
jgi:hypothetical protein